MNCYNPKVTVPKPNSFILKPWDTGSFCHMMNLSNIQTKPDGAFLKFGENMLSNRQGLWTNFMYNTTTPSGVALETYSNIQGAWSRVGPSTYDSVHSIEDPHNRWGVGSFLPMPLKSHYDHPNADPKGMWKPEHYKCFKY